MKKYSAIVLLTFALLISCKSDPNKEKMDIAENSRVEYLPYYGDESFTPNWLTPGSEAEKNYHKISDFSLVNQLGDTISQNTFEGKIYVTDFFFTSCPGICPKLTDNMFLLQEEFLHNSDVLLLSHSVMPTTDSVSVLKSYGEVNGVLDRKWHLVTGDKNEIYNLGRNNYFIENDMGEPKNIDDFLHTENFVLVDKNKHIRGIYNGLNRASVAQLIIDIKTLLSEKSI